MVSRRDIAAAELHGFNALQLGLKAHYFLNHNDIFVATYCIGDRADPDDVLGEEQNADCLTPECYKQPLRVLRIGNK